MKATSESLKAARPSNSTKPLPVKLRSLPLPKQQKPVDNVAIFQFSSEQKLQSTSDALRSQKKATRADRVAYLADFKSQLAEQRNVDRKVPLA